MMANHCQASVRDGPIAEEGLAQAAAAESGPGPGPGGLHWGLGVAPRGAVLGLSRGTVDGR